MSNYYTRRMPVDPRLTYIDRYPRDYDPNRPTNQTQMVRTTPQASPRDASAQVSLMADMFRSWRVRPSQRPFVYQKKLTFSLPVATTATVVMNQTFPCDAFILNNPSTNANSVFWGDQGVNGTQGMEIQPGLPVLMSCTNTRQLWEVQNALKDVSALLVGSRTDVDPPTPELAPRVVFDMNDQYMISPAGAQTITVMLFFVPELQ